MAPTECFGANRPYFRPSYYCPVTDGPPASFTGIPLTNFCRYGAGFSLIKSAFVSVGRFTWLGSDVVGMNIDDMDGFEEVLLGAMTIETYTKRVPQFQKYFESLTLENAKNPWFPLLWSELFDCTWNASSDLTNVTHCNSTRKYRILDSVHYTPERTVSIILVL